jgi:hypothetical protein
VLDAVATPSHISFAISSTTRPAECTACARVHQESTSLAALAARRAQRQTAMRRRASMREEMMAVESELAGKARWQIATSKSADFAQSLPQLPKPPPRHSARDAQVCPPTPRPDASPSLSEWSERLTLPRRALCSQEELLYFQRMPPHVQRAIERTRQQKAASRSSPPPPPTPSTPMVVLRDDGDGRHLRFTQPIVSHQMLPTLPRQRRRRPAAPPNAFSRIVSNTVRNELIRSGQQSRLLGCV